MKKRKKVTFFVIATGYFGADLRSKDVVITEREGCAELAITTDSSSSEDSFEKLIRAVGCMGRIIEGGVRIATKAKNVSIPRGLKLAGTTLKISWRKAKGVISITASDTTERGYEFSKNSSAILRGLIPRLKRFWQPIPA